MNSAKVQSIIETTFLSAIEQLTNDETGGFINDLYVQVDPESGELQIYDDNETLLGKIVIFNWIGKKEESDFQGRVIATLKAVLTVLSTKNVFDHDRFMKPLSVSLTDEDFQVVEELLFIDDDLCRLDDPLLKDLDTDLDAFLLHLLSDVE